jgi:elongation factor P hydroxylase
MTYLTALSCGFNKVVSWLTEYGSVSPDRVQTEWSIHKDVNLIVMEAVVNTCKSLANINTTAWHL